MKPTDNYAYSFDNERYYEQCDSIEEALAAAKIDAENDDDFKDAKTVYIGRVYKFVPEVDAWAVLENLWDDAYEETEETMDGNLSARGGFARGHVRGDRLGADGAGERSRRRRERNDGAAGCRDRRQAGYHAAAGWC